MATDRVFCWVQGRGSTVRWVCGFELSALFSWMGIRCQGSGIRERVVRIGRVRLIGTSSPNRRPGIPWVVFVILDGGGDYYDGGDSIFGGDFDVEVVGVVQGMFSFFDACPISAQFVPNACQFH